MFDIVEQMLPQEFLVQMQPAVVESLIFSCFFYAFMKILHFEDGANRFIYRSSEEVVLLVVASVAFMVEEAQQVEVRCRKSVFNPFRSIGISNLITV